MKLPRVADVKRINPSGQVPYAPMSDVSIGSGVKALGQAIGDAYDRDQEYKAAKAEADFLVYKNEQDHAYHDRNDYENFETEYTENLQKRFDEATANVQDARLKAELQNRYRVSMAQGRQRINDLSRLKERDQERAYIDSMASTLSEQGSSGDMIAARSTFQNLLNLGAEKGYFKHEEAGEILRNWELDTALNKVKLMAPENRAKALDMPWANNLPAHVKAEIKRDAEEEQMAGKAIVTADEYMDKNLTRAEAMEEMAKIKDPHLRKETERRFDYIYAKSETANFEDNKDKFKEYFLPVRSGEMSVDDVPNDVLKQMEPEMVRALFAAEQSSVKPPPQSDREVLFKLYAYHNGNQPQKAFEYFIDNAKSLSQSDFNKWSDMVTEGVMPPEYDSLLSTTQMTKTALISAGITQKGAQDQLLGEVEKWHQRYFELNQGKTPTDDQIQKKVDSLLLSHKSSWFGRGTPVFQMDEEERVEMMQDLQEDNAKLFEDVRQHFESKGIDPTYDEFLSAYKIIEKSRAE